MSEAEAFLARLDRVEPRLAEHASGPPPGGLTDPHPPTGERWEAGQVWAHLAEFVPFWLGQIAEVTAGPGDGAVPFGRTQSAPGRLAAIERDRATAVADLWARLRGQLDELRATLSSMPADAWSRRGAHPTLGEMTVSRMVEEFLVGHLEEHADQLDGLARASG